MIDPGRTTRMVEPEYEQVNEVEDGEIIRQVGVLRVIVLGKVISKTLDASSSDFCLIVNEYVVS
jgi:hypothetical protein